MGCVCTFVYNVKSTIYLYMYIHTCIYIYVYCIYLCIYVLYMYRYVHTHTHVCVCMSVCVCVCVLFVMDFIMTWQNQRHPPGGSNSDAHIYVANFSEFVRSTPSIRNKVFICFLKKLQACDWEY